MEYPPEQTTEIKLEGLSAHEFLVLAVHTAKKLDWNISNINKTGYKAYTQSSMGSWNEEIKIAIAEESATFYDCDNSKRNTENFTITFHNLKSLFTHEELAQGFSELEPTFTSDTNEPGQLKKISDVLSMLVPSANYFVTPILVYLNVLIFILMVASGVNFMAPDTASLIKWGANLRPATLDGEWWRLITNCFLHIGILHLLLNMYALVYIGLLLEPLLGKLRFATAYLLTGIIASLASLWWHPLTVSAGASGAIFGMYGVFLAMLTTNIIDKTTRQPMLTSIVVFIGYNLINGLKGGIDNAAHIGGLTSGIVIGYSFYPGLKQPGSVNLKYITTGALTVLTFVISFFVYRSIPNDIGIYDAKMKSFASMEQMAMDVYNLPGNTPKEKILSEIKNKGIYYWNENIKLLNDLKKLDLPAQITVRDEKLTEYCNLRIKNYEFLYKKFDESTDKYDDSIKTYNKQIEAIIDSLKEQNK